MGFIVNAMNRENSWAERELSNTWEKHGHRAVAPRTEGELNNHRAAPFAAVAGSDEGASPPIRL